jgi:hypothetical protein
MSRARVRSGGQPGRHLPGRSPPADRNRASRDPAGRGPSRTPRPAGHPGSAGRRRGAGSSPLPGSLLCRRSRWGCATSHAGPGRSHREQRARRRPPGGSPLAPTGRHLPESRRPSTTRPSGPGATISPEAHGGALGVQGSRQRRRPGHDLPPGRPPAPGAAPVGRVVVGRSSTSRTGIGIRQYQVGHQHPPRRPRHLHVRTGWSAGRRHLDRLVLSAIRTRWSGLRGRAGRQPTGWPAGLRGHSATRHRTDQVNAEPQSQSGPAALRSRSRNGWLQDCLTVRHRITSCLLQPH